VCSRINFPTEFYSYECLSSECIRQSDFNQTCYDMLSSFEKAMFLCFFSEDTTIKNGFFIKIVDNIPNLMKDFYQTQILNRIAYLILSNGKVDTSSLNKLIELTEKAINNDPAFIETCGFLLQFLNCLYSYRVFSFFSNLIRSESTIIHSWLTQVQFATILLSELMGFSFLSQLKDEDDVSKLVSKGFQLVCALFNQKHPIISNPIQFVSMISSYSNLPPSSEDSKWEALKELYCNDTSKHMRQYFESIVSVLYDHNKVSRSTGVSIVKLLTKMIEDATLISSFEALQVPTSVAYLIPRYPEISKLQIACMSFLKKAINKPKLMKSALNSTAEVILICKASSQEALLLSASKLVRDLSLNDRKKAIDIPGFPSLIKDLCS